MSDRNSKVIGHWKLLKVLGSGGFGEVTLWYDTITGQKIAIKKLLKSVLTDTTAKAKLTERWCNEVEIMKKLNHPNIVATLEIPTDLHIVEPLPILAMEYCSNGNLREVLNKPENCCGLQEPEVLDILRDISNGLAYLHSCKIIHRDIKPENIVLQDKGGGIIYKLIDLGYAKTLDQSSLSKSFVGTVQYIAPELFMGKAYTSSVDYWSFGLMTHEIITGFRPFLPGFHPSDWMKQIQNKSREFICVMQNYNGEILFSTKISRSNHMSRCFLEDIENWLRLALNWDGQTRGRDLNTNRLIIFENLSEIICKKTIHVFSLPTFEILSYEVDTETDIIDLREWLSSNAGVDKDDQHLLLSSGKCLNTSGNLLKNIETEKILFLYNSGYIRVRIDGIRTPGFVDELRDSSNICLSYSQLKRCCADTVYFVQSQANLCRNLLKGIKLKINNIKQKTLTVESLYEDLEEEWNRIEYYGHFLSLSLKIDLENYINHRKTGKLKSSSFVRKWIQNAVEVNNKITKLKNMFNKTKQRQLMLLTKQICRNLDHQSSNDVSHRTPLDSLVEKGLKLWENFKNCPKDDKISLSTSTLVDLINKTIEETNKFLSSEMLKTLFRKISEADENLAKFLSHVTNVYKSTNVLKSILENTQIERQKEVWSLIEGLKGKENGTEKKEEMENEERKEKKDLGQNIGDEVIEKSGEKSQEFPLSKESEGQVNGSRLSVSSESLNLLCFPNLQEAKTVIEDNNHLRYRIQEVQQTCNKMLKDLTSLNWDFIEIENNQNYLETKQETI